MLGRQKLGRQVKHGRNEGGSVGESGTGKGWFVSLITHNRKIEEKGEKKKGY